MFPRLLLLCSLPLGAGSAIAPLPIAGCGSKHSFFIKTDSTVYAAGWNAESQLGDGALANQDTPVLLGITDIIGAAAGLSHSVFVSSGGTAYTVGDNAYGQLGDNSNTDRSSIVTVSVTDVQSVAAGHYHSIFIKSSGTFLSAGYNSKGQLGDGGTTNQNTPTAGAVSGIQSATASDTWTIFVKSDGGAYGVGENVNGQLGVGDNDDKSTPTSISITSLQSASAGSNFALLLKSDGTVYVTGNNADGQLGDGTTLAKNSPVLLTSTGVSSGIQAVAAGDLHSLFLTSAGSVYGSGKNTVGEYGDATTTSKSTPVLSQISGVQGIAAGSQHSLFVKTDGSGFYATGYNQQGQLGDGSSPTSQSTPVFSMVSSSAHADDVLTVTPTSVTVGVSSTLTITSASTDLLYWCMQSGGSCSSTCTSDASSYMPGGWTAVTMGAIVTLTYITGASAATGTAVFVMCVAEDSAGNGVELQTSISPFSVVAVTSPSTYTLVYPSPVTLNTYTFFSLTVGTGVQNEKIHLSPVDTGCVYGASDEQVLTGPSFYQSLSTCATYILCVTASGGTDSIAQGGFSVLTTCPATAGDPVAYFGDDRKIPFWLPLGIMMPLLRTSDVDIFGSTYRGLAGKHGQYFDRFVVASRGGLTMDVGLRRSLDNMPTSQLPHDDNQLFRTHNVTDLKTMKVGIVEGHIRGDVGYDDSYTQIMALHTKELPMLTPQPLPAEAVEVYSESVHFTICSAYVVENRPEKHLYLDYGHLALQIVAMPESKHFTGIFPELWGLRPMSPCTKLLSDMDKDAEDLPTPCHDWGAYQSDEAAHAVEQLPASTYTDEL